MNVRSMSGQVGWIVCGGALLGAIAGCAHVQNHFREDGPSVTADWDSPTAMDVKARFQPAQPRHREWPRTTLVTQRGAVVHWPLYFEDPFVDKGAGRTDATDPHNVYRWDWEDYVAIPYGISRFTVNWLFLPVSAIVTPPCTVMESDGRLSKQLLGYDHDAEPLNHAAAPTVDADEPSPAEPAADEEPAETAAGVGVSTA